MFTICSDYPSHLYLTIGYYEIQLTWLLANLRLNLQLGDNAQGNGIASTAIHGISICIYNWPCVAPNSLGSLSWYILKNGVMAFLGRAWHYFATEDWE